MRLRDFKRWQNQLAREKAIFVKLIHRLCYSLIQGYGNVGLIKQMTFLIFSSDFFNIFCLYANFFLFIKQKLS